MKKIFFSLFSVLAILACKKEEQLTLTQQLAKNDWKKISILSSVDSVSDTVPTINELASRPDCFKDNVWHFDASNNTFKLSEGLTKCNSSDPDIKDHGSIEELNNGSQLKVIGTGNQEIWEIESLTASSFRVSYFARNASSQLVKFRVVFSGL